MNDTTYEITWLQADAIAEEHANYPVRQVYVWAKTADDKIAIVSKDGNKWQLPGGKPDADETMTQTAVREMQEETGIAIADMAEQLRFFGYNVVTETTGDQRTIYLQVRYSMALPHQSHILPTAPPAEDTVQDASEQIQYVGYVTPTELTERIKWMKDSEETMAALASLGF